MRREAAEDYADYWEPSKDPDGVLRDRLSDAERIQYLDDAADEIAFVRGLAPGRILDVGCGPGWFLSALDGWERHGTEICPRAKSEASRVADVTERIQLREAYDVVRCHHVIEHVPNPLPLIVDISWVLCRGGWLLLSTPDFASPCAVRFGDSYRMLHDQTHRNLFTLESLTRFVRDYGFSVERVAYPFPERYATAETMERWASGEGVSPPWPGNWITMYCRK